MRSDFSLKIVVFIAGLYSKSINRKYCKKSYCVYFSDVLDSYRMPEDMGSNTPLVMPKASV